MIYSTATLPANPDGKTKVTRAQVWQALDVRYRPEADIR